MILGLFKISGHSMMPKLKPNDRVIVSSTPYFFSKPKVGDIILFEYDRKLLVKRISEIWKGKFFVSGENNTDSLKVNPIERDKILAKVLFKIS